MMQFSIYKGVKGFIRLYNYGYKYTRMITKEAQERLRILIFWKTYGIKATKDAFKVSCSAFFDCQRIYRDNGSKIEALNPNSQARHTQQRREVDHGIIAEIRRLRFEVCPNMGKDKVKVFLNDFCKKSGLKTISASTIGRVIKDKKTKDFVSANPGDLKDYFKRLKIALPYRIKSVQTDNGSEFCKYFADYLPRQHTIHYWNYKGQPYKNGHIEKFNRTMQEEFIDRNKILLDELENFNRKVIDYLLWYNTKRPHWSLKLKSPVNHLLNINSLSEMRWTDTSA